MFILNMFSGLADSGGLRRLVWISRIGMTLFVTVMLALFAAFGPFAVLAIVRVVPALITGGARLHGTSRRHRKHVVRAALCGTGIDHREDAFSTWPPA
jgi:hypothetical protein